MTIPDLLAAQLVIQGSLHPLSDDDVVSEMASLFKQVYPAEGMAEKAVTTFIGNGDMCDRSFWLSVLAELGKIKRAEKAQ